MKFRCSTTGIPSIALMAVFLALRIVAMDRVPGKFPACAQKGPLFTNVIANNPVVPMFSSMMHMHNVITDYPRDIAAPDVVVHWVFGAGDQFGEPTATEPTTATTSTYCTTTSVTTVTTATTATLGVSSPGTTSGSTSVHTLFCADC